MPTFQNLSSINAIQTIDPFLTDLLVGYKPTGYILDKLFLEVPVGTDFGGIAEVNAPLQIDGDLQLSPSGFPTITIDIQRNRTFQLSNHGLQAFLSPADYQKLGGASRAKEITNQLLDDKLMGAREYRAATVLTDAAIMTTNYTPSVAWSDYDNMTAVVKDFALARKYVRKGTGVGASKGCGKRPNLAIVPLDVFEILINHPALTKAWLRGVSNQLDNGVLTQAALAYLMGVDEILVPEAMYDASEGGVTKSLTDIWGDYVIFAYVSKQKNPNQAVQSLGYTFKPNTPEQGFPEFTYEWVQPGTLPQMGTYLVRGRKYQDNVMDVNCACLLNVTI